MRLLIVICMLLQLPTFGQEGTKIPGIDLQGGVGGGKKGRETGVRGLLHLVVRAVPGHGGKGVPAERGGRLFQSPLRVREIRHGERRGGGAGEAVRGARLSHIPDCAPGRNGTTQDCRRQRLESIHRPGGGRPGRKKEPIVSERGLRAGRNGHPPVDGVLFRPDESRGRTGRPSAERIVEEVDGAGKDDG